MEQIRWRGLSAVYAESERDVMRSLPTAEQWSIHALKSFTHGEISQGRVERTGSPSSETRVADFATGSGEPVDKKSPVYTDPEDLEFGRPKKTRPIYALVWTHKQHKVYKTKAKAQRASRAWKLWYERWGFKVSSHATGFFAVKEGTSKRACLIHEYDKDSKVRLK